MKLHILGLPLTPESVTDEFLAFIKQPNVILIQSSVMPEHEKQYHNDYVTARIGYELLFSHEYAFTEHVPENQTAAHTIYTKQLWTKDRNGQRVTEQVIDIYHELQQNNPSSVIAYITPGSPRLYDVVSKNLTNSNLHVNIIDTRSSAELSVDYLVSNNLIPDLEINVLDNRVSREVKNDCINIFGCLGNVYQVDIKPIVSELMSTISSNAKIFKIKLSNEIHAEKLTKIELVRQLLVRRGSFNSSLVVFVN